MSHIAQIIALVLAGIWTYKTFYESERPGLEAKPDVTSDLFWMTAPDPGFCDAGFKVEFQDTGKQSLDTAKVHFEGWLAEPPEPTGDKPTFIDPHNLEKPEKKFFDLELAEGPLVGHFPPGIGGHDTVIWRFKKSPKSFVLFRATIEGTSRHGYFGKKDYFQVNASNWEAVCGDIKKAEPAK